MKFKLINNTERKENEKLFKNKEIKIDTLEELIELVDSINIPPFKARLFSGNTIVKKNITITKNPPEETVEDYDMINHKWYLKTIINKYQYSITVTDYNDYN